MMFSKFEWLESLNLKTIFQNKIQVVFQIQVICQNRTKSLSNKQRNFRSTKNEYFKILNTED